MAKYIRPPRHRGIYLLPNLFTTSALFAGFYAIVASMRGDFDLSAIAIFVAMLMDTLDGRIARLTNTQSEFGAQYDTISDIVNFGVAPALIIYNWGLFELGKLGWMVAFFYVAACALRLARFNTKLNDEAQDIRFFEGLPCPMPAGVIAGIVWWSHDVGIPGKHLWWLAAVVTVILAILMISKVLYFSFKKIDLRKKLPSITALLVALILMFIAYDPPKVLLMVFALFTLSGPVFSIKRLLHQRRLRRPKVKNNHV